MSESLAVNDNKPSGGKSRFNYSAPAELFMIRARSVYGRSNGYRRFPTAAEAIRFAIEDIPQPLLLSAVMEVQEERFDHHAIRALYQRQDYPLTRS